MFNCELCCYNTKTKGNLNIHFKSKKHINNMKSDNSVCSVCGKTFIHKSSLSRHKNSCVNKSLSREDVQTIIDLKLKDELISHFIRGYFDQKNINEETELNEKCWDGYKQVGSKKKNGKMVPNCVPVSEVSNSAKQAATAINMKKKGVDPKNQSEKEMYEAMEIDESKNCPTDPAKWAASKAKAKSKFDVYPSAYANGFAAKDYKAKGGGWRKCK